MRKVDIRAYKNSLRDKAKAMRRAVPKYMMPNLYERLGQMPYNGNGKIDRVQLKARFLGQ